MPKQEECEQKIKSLEAKYSTGPNGSNNNEGDLPKENQDDLQNKQNMQQAINEEQLKEQNDKIDRLYQMIEEITANDVSE